MGKAKPLTILKIIVSVLLGVVVSLLLFVFMVVIIGSIRDSIASYIFNATLLGIMCISILSSQAATLSCACGQPHVAYR